MISLAIQRRQVNPAAFSGVTDQISNAGSAAGSKAADATSGLSRTQFSILIVCIVVGLVAGVAGMFWLCSCSRRRKRAREMRNTSELLITDSATKGEMAPAFIAAPVDKRSSKPHAYNKDWGESRVALNSSFGGSHNNQYDQGHRQPQNGYPARPQPSQQSYGY